MENGNEIKSAFNQKYSLTARRIMRLISSDSRVKITTIANALNVSRRTAALKLENMEREFNLHYTLEFDEEQIGLNRPHLILAKFKGKPDYNHIKELLGKSYIPQFAASISGNYNLLIYANAMSGMEYARWDKLMQMLLAPYKAEWHSSEVVHRQLGFFPLRNEILEKVKIKEKYKRILYILNNNSRISFQELAKQLNMNVNTAVYNFNKILKMNYIKSFTTTMEIPANVSAMTFFSKYVPSEGYEAASAKARSAFMNDEEDPLISRYLVTAPLIGSYDFFTLGIFDNSAIAYSEDVLYHKSLFKNYGIKMRYGEIKEVLLGRLPIRSINTRKDYKTLVWST